jgi:hypothetical protein
MVGAVGGLALIAVLVGRRLHDIPRASLFALAGATVMGSQSALLAVTLDNLQQGPVVLFTAWQTYLLIVASIGGLMLLQSAFAEGPLAASMPVIDAGEPTTAIVIGILLFGETLAPGTLRHVLAAVGAVVALVGIVMLDTSPGARRVHEKEQEEGQEQEE